TPCVKPELTIHQPTAPSAAPAPKIVHSRIRRRGGMAPRQRKYKNGSRNTAPVSRAIRRCDHSHQKIVLKASRLMPRLSSRYCGIAWYFVNSLCQSLSDSGGRTPVTGFHSTIERPDSVSRVAPPMMSVAKIMAAAQNSQRRTARSGSWKILSGSAIGLLAGDGADHIVLRAAPQMTAGNFPMSIRTRKLIGTIALLVLVITWGLLAMALAQSVLTDINGFVAAI